MADGNFAYVPGSNVVIFKQGYTINLQTGQPHALDAAALVEFRVQTTGYADVPGQAWPSVCTLIAGSAGDFLGVIADGVAMQPYQEYRLIGHVYNGINQVGFWDVPLHARPRS